jgi:hypothetical protein
MVWAFMERELDLVRHKIKTIDHLKRRVLSIWNRIPKKLCLNIVKRFQYMVDTVAKNKGNKENTKDRRDRRVKFKLTDRTQWANKYFPEYTDKITRIAYSEKTFEVFKDKYRIFLDKEIAFYKRIIAAIGIYII